MVKTDDPILIDLLLEYTKAAGIAALNAGCYGVTDDWTVTFERMELANSQIYFRARLHSSPTDKLRTSWFYKAVIDRATGRIVRVAI